MAITPVDLSKVSKGTRFINSLGGRTLLPLLMTEAAVEIGRTYQAYQRGGFTEARERITEEFLGAVCWFGAIPVVDSILEWLIGDKILNLPKEDVSPGKLRKFFRKMVGKNPDTPIKKLKAFDVGIDVGRNSISNYVDELSKSDKFINETKETLTKKIGNYRILKIGSAVLAGTLLVGCALPKFNQWVTRVLKKKSEANETSKNIQIIQPKIDDFINNSVKNINNKDITFTGGMLNFVNVVENTKKIQLATEDVGVMSGRAANARNKYERREVLFRDFSSTYFYLFNMPVMASVLNKIQHGSKARLDAVSATVMTDDIKNILNEFGNNLSLDEFEKVMFGDNTKIKQLKLDEIFDKKGVVKREVYEQLGLEVPEEKRFLKFFKNIFGKNKNSVSLVEMKDIDKEQLKEFVSALGKEGHINFDDFENLLNKLNIQYTDNLKNLARDMATLQPAIGGKRILTGTQIVDLIQGGKVNSPGFMHHLTQIASTSDFLNVLKDTSTYKGDYSYTSQKTILSKKADFKQFVSECIKKAKSEGKGITTDLLEKCKKSNVKINAFNWGSAFVVTAIMVSTVVPKLQYLLTRITTGSDRFPGTEMSDDQPVKVK